MYKPSFWPVTCVVILMVIRLFLEIEGGMPMLVLVTYDVNTTTPEGRRRLRQVAKQCVNYGQRVQNSVFECLVDQAQFLVLRKRLEEIVDPEKDSLRYYILGNNWKNRVQHYGAKKSFDPEGVLVL